MNQEILTQLEEIFKDIFELDELALNNETKASDIEEWDSLNHIQLVVAIEKNYNIKFTAAEIQKWENVGAICDSISSKLN